MRTVSGEGRKQARLGPWPLLLLIAWGLGVMASFTPATGQPLGACARLETSPGVYSVGQMVNFTFHNNCAQTVDLSNTAPYVIYDSLGSPVFQPIALTVITSVPSGGSMSWDWNQRDQNNNQVPAGTYAVVLKTMNAGSYATSFGIQQPPNIPPTITSLSDSPDPVLRPNPLTLTASGVNDLDGSVSRVEFYRDANGNGALEVETDILLGSDTSSSGGWGWSGATAGFPLGLNTYFARAQDNGGDWSSAVSSVGTVTDEGRVTVSIDAPEDVRQGSDFLAQVNITRVVNLDAYQFDVIYNPAVLLVTDVTDGRIDSTAAPIAMWGFIPIETQGRIRVLGNFPGFTGITGSGYLVQIRFLVVGSPGQGSNIILSNGLLFNNMGNQIGPVSWGGDSVSVVAFLPGDADKNGSINMGDITKVERIILGLDPPALSADANKDASINMGDVTKIERVILELIS